MRLDKLGKKLRREIAASPKKAALLGLITVAALYFWAPLVLGWLGKDKATPSAEPTPAAAAEPSATQPAPPTAVADAPPSLPSWEQVVQWMRDFLDSGGVVTWDVHIQPNGLIPEAMLAQLKAIDKGLRAPAPPRVPVPPGNLATGGRAMLLDITGGKPLPPNMENRFASLGVDGDPATLAQGSMEWPWTYHVDLGEVAEIRRVVITFAEFYATEYEVVLSRDGKEWKSVAHATGAKGGRAEHSFPPVAARYVRIKGLKPDGPNQPGGQMSIAELEVYR